MMQMRKRHEKASKLKQLGTSLCKTLLCLTVGLHVFGCGDKVEFTRQATTQFFIQDYNPEFLDLLWMVEDRSPMARAAGHLIPEAARFFQRLDSATHNYRMAFVSADMQINPGLKPIEYPKPLTNHTGSLEQRIGIFSDFMSLIINLNTGGLNQGFESVLMALNELFIPRSGVPLVIIFISDSDESKGVANKESIQYYAESLLALKDNNPDLLRVYSINYLPIPNPDDRNDTNRCAQRYNADIDLPGYEDPGRYFALANALPGGQTADLCGDFADDIDLSGLRLNELKTVFQLEDTPDPSTIKVKIFNEVQEFPGYAFSYNPATNEIVFDVPPPEGTTIQVTYLPVE